MVAQDRLDLETSSRTLVLFLDMREMAVLHGVVQSAWEAQRHPLNPVLPLGDLHEWDSMRAAPWGVRPAIYDPADGVFKLWYSAMDGTAAEDFMAGYAISADGVHWDKPVLGLYDYGGSKQNNICHKAIGSIILDDADPDPSQRFKMFAKRPGKGVRMGYSADGRHWDFETRLDMARMLSAKSLGVKGKMQSPNVFLRDDDATDPNRRYQIWWMLVQKTDQPELPGKEWVRTKSLALSPDALTWTSAETTPALTPNDSTEHENHHLLVYPYQGYYIMLYEYGWFAQNGRGGPYGQYCADLRLAVSRDGEHYTRVLTNQKILPRGTFGQWDDGFLGVADKPVVKDGTIYIYYCGQDHNYPGFGGDMFYPDERSGNERRASMRVSQMGLATLPMDRFTALQTFDGETPGYAVTQPIRVASPTRTRLILNVSDAIPWRSWVAVEVLDAATRQPIEGYSRSDCQPVACDGLRLPVRWERQSTLEGVTASRIALRFGIYGNAKLHSFTFA